MAENVLSHDV